jgi:SAM-dependent methyltransferase
MRMPDPNRRLSLVLERSVIQPEAEGIADFYGTLAGQIARRAILARLKALWPGLFGYRLLGFGFAIPYLSAFGAERAIAAGPAALGVTRWPPERATSLLCDEDALPFADSLFDRVLLVHGLERAESLRPLLRQLWRVLAPEGRLLVVAPNRASLWAQVETTPFGHGRPFSRRQLDRILREALFEPQRWERALYAPPLATRFLASHGGGWERAGGLLFPALCGVHVMEAKKSIYGMTPLPVTEAAPLLTPDLPSPA